MDEGSVCMLDKILNDTIRSEYEQQIKTMEEDLNFLREENTGLSIEITEIKYNLQNVEKERSDIEEKHNNLLNEIYMLKKSIENLKDNDRKIQNEYDIVELEEEKHRIKCELEKHNKEHSISLFTGAASLSIGKIMSQLSQYEADSISKINKADIKSEYAQTEICDINNILISQRPSDINNSKPQK